MEGLTVATEQDVLGLQQKYHQSLEKVGETYAYHNGWLVNDLRPSRVSPGDVIEYVYDSSVYRVVDFAVKDLETYESTLDSKRKYLLNYPEFNNATIDFEDDIDFYLFKREDDGRMRGYTTIATVKTPSGCCRTRITAYRWPTLKRFKSRTTTTGWT